MAEFEELRLKITLIDEASTGIKLLTSSVSNLGNTVGKGVTPQLGQAAQGIAKVGKETKELHSKLQGVTSGLSSLSATIIQVGQGVGLIGRMPLALGGILGAIAGINIALSQFADKMLDLRARAMSAGIVPDQFMNMVNQMKQFGLSTEKAEGYVISFHRTVREANKAGTAEFNRMFSGEASDPANVSRFMVQMGELINSGKSEEAFSKVVRQAQVIWNREMKKPGGRQEATRQVEAMLSMFGLDIQALKLGNLSPFDNATKWQERIDMAEKFKIEWQKLLEVLNDIIYGIQKELLPAFSDLNKEIAKLGEGWGQTLGKSISDTLKEILAFLQFWRWLFNAGGGQGGLGNMPNIGAMDILKYSSAPMMMLDTLKRWLGIGMPDFGIRERNRREGTTAPGAPALPPAAPGGDIYTDKYGIWPGGGSKPYGSDVGPGTGPSWMQNMYPTGGGSGGAAAPDGIARAGMFGRLFGSGGGAPPGRSGPIGAGGPISLAATAPRPYEQRQGILGEFNAAKTTGEFGQPGNVNTKTIRLSNDQKLNVNPLVANRFEGGINEMIARGYPVDIGTSGGGYNPRAGRGSSKPSEHAFGTAVDINVPQNPFLPQGGGRTNMPEDVEPLAWKHGLSWGGRFGDPMHFEAMGKEAWAAKRNELFERGLPVSPQDVGQFEPGAGKAVPYLDRSAIDQPMGREISPQTVEGSGNVDVTITSKGSNVEASGEGMFEGNVEKTQERQLQ